MDLIGELDAGRRCTDNKHAARLKLVGLRYTFGVSVAIDEGTAEASDGTTAMLQAPAASTTIRQSQSPRSVATE